LVTQTLKPDLHQEPKIDPVRHEGGVDFSRTRPRQWLWAVWGHCGRKRMSQKDPLIIIGQPLL